MHCYDVIIVGSGPAGIGAALAFEKKGLDVLVIDAGQTSDAEHTPRPDVSLPAHPLPWLKKQGYTAKHFPLFIGTQFESCQNAWGSYLNPKLKAPLMRFITHNAEKVLQIDSSTFSPVISAATGGLGNAWGAGAYRYLHGDLQGFPVTEQELQPYFDRLTAQMGISGCSDDLDPFFGSSEGLLPPLDLNRTGAQIMDRYRIYRGYFHKHGVFIGRARLAVNSIPYRGRPAYDYSGLEYFRPSPAIYNPAWSLEKLVRERSVSHVSGTVIRRFHETKDHITVVGEDISHTSQKVFYTRFLILAAGTLSSAAITLLSFEDKAKDVRLPILENPVTFIPMLNPSLIASPPPGKVTPAQLNLVYDGPLSEKPIQGTLYDLNALLATDLLFDFPLSVKGCLASARALLPAMCIVQLFYPASFSEHNWLTLRAKGKLEVQYRAKHPSHRIEKQLLHTFRKIGFWGLSKLCRHAEPGQSFHYAGALPMQEKPQLFETDRFGRLGGTSNVFVVDASTFPHLPSKNLTFMVMANALRVAEGIVKEATY